MRFLDSKFTQNALAVGASHRTPLGEIKRSPDPLADFRGPLRGRGKGKGGEKGRKRGGERGRGYWGREGKSGGRERGRRREREGRRDFASLALEEIDAPV